MTNSRYQGPAAKLCAPRASREGRGAETPREWAWLRGGSPFQNNPLRSRSELRHCQRCLQWSRSPSAPTDFPRPLGVSRSLLCLSRSLHREASAQKARGGGKAEAARRRAGERGRAERTEAGQGRAPAEDPARASAAEGWVRCATLWYRCLSAWPRRT
ncbi:Protein of unknown function [Gryllus bimaculatus]|nr:Protein of unknown function [Gryllus bimaculatus]